MRREIFILIMILILAPVLAGAQANIPHALVNGVLLDAPVRNVNGTLLLPMRAVFEALQAEVRWFPAARQITVVRGDVTVQLWIDRPVAIVNDREIPLAVPPTLFDNNTYVPLRFPAEAFGGEVEWRGAERLAVVTLAPLTETPVIEVDKNTPRAAQVGLTGVLVSHAKADNGETLVIRDQQTGALQTVTVPAGTALTRNREAAAFAGLLPGDLVVITRDPDGNIQRVEATYQLVNGKVAGFAEGKLLLVDGGLYQVNPQARALDTGGNVVGLADLQQGRDVTLRLTPGTMMIWEITLPAPTPAPDPVHIASVTAPGYAGPLKRGDTLTLRVTGDPGADWVTARVGEAIVGLELTEGAPGVYSGRITLGPDLPPANAPIYAIMCRGTKTGEAQSQEKIIIDMQGPQLKTLDPGPDVELFDPNPVIAAALSDDGSGVNPATVHLLMNGRDVTAGAEVTDKGIRYPARALQTGATKFHLEVADRAGNTTVRDWQVVVREPADEYEPEIYAVSHDAVRPLRQGDVLTIRVAATPGADRILARVGTAINGIGLAEQEPGRYSGQVTVGRDINADNVPVYATLRQGDVVREAQSVERVTIDTRPPQFTLQVPAQAETFDRNYALGATFSDDDSGIDPRAVRLFLNGRDVTGLAAVSSRDIRYDFLNLPVGASTFRLEMADYAGNVTNREWQVVVRERPPQILSVTQDARGMLKRGDAFTIRVVGTSGADEARARIGNAVTDIRLVEREPGHYSYRVIVDEKVAANDVYVYAVLHRNGIDSEEVRSDRRLTIDSTPPECLSINPQRNTVVQAVAPVIEATYRDLGVGIMPDKVRLQVNGRDVTAQAVVTDHQIRYTAQGFPLGMVKVELALEDQAANVTRVEWAFTLQLPPAILDIAHNAAKPLDPGESVKITARLSVKPTKLEWLLDDRVIGAEMTGGADGVYVFSYTVKPADAAGKHKLGLRCTKETGQSETTYAPALLNIAELKVKDLAITTPDDKAKAPDRLTVVGVAAPHARVRVTIGGSSSILFRREETQVTTLTVNTNDDGLWTAGPIVLPAEKKVRQFIVTAELLDDNGAVTKTVSIRLTR